MNIFGRTMIFKNDYGYSLSISDKKQDGTYEKTYLSVQLPKGVELENKTMIDVKRGFLGRYKTKEGLPKIKVVIQEYDVIKEEDELPF